jgi:cysteine sulfinate desulfinase/cysteine desulfurase-like protein
VVTEHLAVLEPLKKLKRDGYEITLLPVTEAPHDRAGRILPEQVAEAIRDETLLVSVMLANNEIGVLQPLEEIGGICRQRGVLLHTDAAQAVGKIPVDVEQLQVDLMSMKDLVVSTGSACTASHPQPSHVLRALGIDEDWTRGAVRFGLGRFNTAEEVDFAAGLISETVTRLRRAHGFA